MAKKFNPAAGYMARIPNVIVDVPMVQAPVAPNGLSAGVDYSGISTTGNRPYNTDYISYINKALIRGGMNDRQRAAVLANIIEESGGNPFAEGPGGFYGLLQWSDERYPRTEETDPYKEIDNQVKSILSTQHNLTDRMSWNRGNSAAGYTTLRQPHSDYMSDDLGTVMRGYTIGYVRPSGGMNSYNNRLKVAEQLYNLSGFRTFDGGGKLQALAQKILDGGYEYSAGGKIHIKPENRGKFTALKERTGHSATWFKEHGTPAQKKMAVFALNARKWKHGDGGLLDRLTSTYGDNASALEAIWKIKAHKFRGGGKVDEVEFTDSQKRQLYKHSNGVLGNREIGLMQQYPQDWALRAFTPDQLAEYRQNVYDNFLPIGYNKRRMKAAAHAAFKYPSIPDIQDPEGYDIAVRDDYFSSDQGQYAPSYPSIRDEALSLYLQPHIQRDRNVQYFEPATDSPARGATYDRVYKMTRAANPYFEDNLVQAYIDAVSGKSNTKPVGKDGKKNTTRGIAPGRTLGFWNVWPRRRNIFYGRGNGTPEDTALGTWTLSTGVDPEKGQYISLYDDYDLNPGTGGKSASLERWVGEFPIDVQDFTGGFGNPFSVYDRIYLNNYYGVSPKLEKDSYYGGWLVPATVTAKGPKGSDKKD